MAQQISTNTFGVSKWVVSADPTQGTHTTIQAAITAASSGDNIFVRTGTYTENLTLKAGVNLAGLHGDGEIPTVTIIGNCTHNTTGTVTMSDFRLQTNGSFCVSNTGTLVSILNFLDCVFNLTNNTGISFTNSNAAAKINITTSAIDLGTTGIAIYSMSSAGTLSFRFCNNTNSGGTSTASTSSAGTVEFFYTNLLSPVSTSGTSVFNNAYSSINTSAQNATCQTSTGNGTHTANYSSYSSGTASALSIGGSSTQGLSNATIISSNANAVTGSGSGTIRYSLLRFSGTSAGINVPTTTPFVAANLIGTTVSISADTSAGTILVGTGAAVKTSTLGSTNTTSATTVQSGSGALNITSTNGTLTINSGTGALSISTDASATTVNIATGAAAKVVTLGSTTTTSSLALKYGTADFTLASATGTIMSALDTGEITYPKQSAFLAYNSTNRTNQSGAGGSVIVTFDTEVFDQNADFASNTFTAPVTGRYFLYSNVLLSNLLTAADSYLIFVTSNRSYTTLNYISAFAVSATNFAALQGTALADMDAADTVTVNVACSGQATTVGFYGQAAPGTFFCGNLVC